MKYILLSIFSLVFFTNCLTTPMPGALVTVTSQHLNTGSNGNAITSAKVEKSGRSCSFSFFIANYFYYGVGQSIEDAAKSGNIKKIAVVDRSSVSILGSIFYQECVVVWGE